MENLILHFLAGAVIFSTGILFFVAEIMKRLNRDSLEDK